jgi:hypothetical protein
MKIKIESVGNHISGHHEGKLVFVRNIGHEQKLIGRASDGSLVGISADNETRTVHYSVGRQVMQSRPSPSVPPFSRPKTAR